MYPIRSDLEPEREENPYKVRLREFLPGGPVDFLERIPDKIEDRYRKDGLAAAEVLLFRYAGLTTLAILGLSMLDKL